MISLTLIFVLIFSMFSMAVPSIQAMDTTEQEVGARTKVGIYGDADLDGKITVKDATRIQKHVAKIIVMNATQQTLSNFRVKPGTDLPDPVFEKGINVKCATWIQKYVAKFKTKGTEGALLAQDCYEGTNETSTMTAPPSTDPTVMTTFPLTSADPTETTSTMPTNEETTVTNPAISNTDPSESIPLTTTTSTESTGTTQTDTSTETSTEASSATTESTKASSATAESTEASSATTESTVENTTEEPMPVLKIPEPTDGTVYLDVFNHGGWLEDNPETYAYFFNKDDPLVVPVWVKGISLYDDKTLLEFPLYNLVDSVIFVTLDPDGIKELEQDKWSANWETVVCRQTVGSTLPDEDDDAKYFVLKDGWIEEEGNDKGKADGEWCGEITTAFQSGCGEENDPYIIHSAKQLVNLADLVNSNEEDPDNGGFYTDAYYKLDRDINLSDYSGGTGWVSIGKNSAPFKGCFNGSGKRISGLTIKNGTGDRIGLFGHVYSATIENVELSGADITGRNSVGAVAGRIEHSTVANCSVTGTENGDTYVGGLVGSVYGSTITDCSADVVVKGKGFIGGLIGEVWGKSTGVEEIFRMENCCATGKVINTASQCTGGLVGYLYGKCTLTNCYAEGNVTGFSGVGGLVGNATAYQEEEGTTLSGCNASGNVSGASFQVGGLVGYLQYGRAENCYATGTVNGVDRNVGGLVGVLSETCSVENCYATGDVNCGLSDYDDKAKWGVGGLVGLAGTVTGEILVKNCYATGNVTSLIESVGGLIGEIWDYGTVENCYAMGAVSGNNDCCNIGGLIGYVYGITVKNCAALNPSVRGFNDVGRVIGFNDSGSATLSDNVAWADMGTEDGIPFIGPYSEDDVNGGDITKTDVQNDSTIGGRFTAGGGWEIQDGELPGLFGQTVEMPSWLRP